MSLDPADHLSWSGILKNPISAIPGMPKGYPVDFFADFSLFPCRFSFPSNKYGSWFLSTSHRPRLKKIEPNSTDFVFQLRVARKR